MLKDCMATHRTLALALLESDERGEARGGLPPIGPIAGVGAIVEHEPLPDGRSFILVQGLARVRLEELPFEPPYRRARARVLADVEERVPQGDVTALVASVTAFVAEVKRLHPQFSLALGEHMEPGGLSDVCAHQCVIDTAARVAILGELRPTERVRLVTQAIAEQHAALLRERGSPLH